MKKNENLSYLQQIKELEKAVGYEFRDKSLLIQALTHPSVAQDGAQFKDNERLEFLGDAIINFLLSEELYKRHPDLDEGELSKIRAYMASKSFLGQIALHFHLDKYVRLGKGEEKNRGRKRISVLANTFEAVVGAIYLDGGLEAVRKLFNLVFEREIANVNFNEISVNPKGVLQEFIQSFSSLKLHYQIETVIGPEHARLYECAVYFGTQELGRGWGTSKKAAEREAALKALKRLLEQNPNLTLRVAAGLKAETLVNQMYGGDYSI